MTDIKDYEDWRKLFRAEQKGKSPEDRMYQPVPEVEISPYLIQKESSNPSFPNYHSGVSHSFVIDSCSVFWLSDFADQLKPYQIKKIYGDIYLMMERKENNSLQKIDFESRVDYKPENNQAPIIFDFRDKAILNKINESAGFLLDSDRDIWITPGDDFLWNIALIRGLRKYLVNISGHTFFSHRFSIYLPLKESEHKENEIQLIPLSNQLLSMMVSGLSHFIWDIRKISDWQHSNLFYLLNVPEILAREGKILIEKDPIQGSDFIEELSDKVFNYLQE